MDLHLTGDQPTDAEKAAVDRVLGPPKSGWEGGQRAEVEGRVSFRAGIPQGPAPSRSTCDPVPRRLD